MRRVAIDPLRPAAAVLEDAAAVIRAAGVVVIPTDTLYGLAADPFSPAAIARVFAVKGRAAERALPLVAADLAQVEEQLGGLPPAGRRLAAAFWPGPLTLLVTRPSTMPDELTGGLEQVGVRVPAHAVPRELCRAAGRLLTATSANLSGSPATADPEEVVRALGGRVDLLLDAGPTAGGPPSTIVNISGAPGDNVARLVRPGAISWDDVRTCLGLA
jgi:L-threonylcarbamoyladenylate synthase